MILENELDDIVVCLKCGYVTDFKGYACEDNYDDLYDDDENLEPTEEDLTSEDERLEAYYSQFEIEDF